MVFEPFSLDEGALLIRLARYAIETELRRSAFSMPSWIPKRLNEVKHGVFVSIERIIHRGGALVRELRGSRGSPRPIKGVAHDVALAAAYAAFRDERWARLTEAEFKRCVVEVTVVSDLFKAERLDDLVLGYHGLYSPPSFVLLPQAMIEKGLDSWDKVRDCACSRADCSKLYAFETQVFYELHPGGTVIERELYKSRVFGRRRPQDCANST